MKKIPVYDSLEDVIAAEDFGDVSAGSRTMIKNLPGVSITSKPRRDGRYQGYCISGDTKTYFYGRTQEEVAVKIKHFLQSGGVRKRKKRKKESVRYSHNQKERRTAFVEVKRKSPRLPLKADLVYT